MDYKNLSKIADSYKSSKEEFYKWAKEHNLECKGSVKNCFPEASTDIKVGDKVIYTNDYGIEFGPIEVLAVEYDETKPNKAAIYLDKSAYWFPQTTETLRVVENSSEVTDSVNKLEETEDVIEVEYEGKPTVFYGGFRDGRADLTLAYSDYPKKRFTLVYPIAASLSDEQIEEIEEWTGRELKEYFDVALKYGELQ